MRRVLVIVPVAVDADGLRRRERQAEEVRLPSDIRLEYRPVRAGPALFDSHHDWMLADLAVFEAGMHAEREGYAAVCVDTISDSGVAPLRSVLDIPVVGPGRSSYLTALMLGDRFSVLTQWDGWTATYVKRVHELGLDAHLASVRAIGIPPDVHNLLAGKEDEVVSRLVEEGCRCVEEDGAEVICMGSTTMHEAAARVARELPVPVINPGPLTYKIVETLLDLELTHSRRAYRRPDAPQPELVETMLAAAEAAQRASAVDGARR